MIDRLRQLAIFAKTIDQGSFRAAARELRLSPSVVSHHIAALEQHLGVALMYRTTRKISLTSEGERLLLATNNMLEAIEGELAALSASANEPSGELKIAVPAVLSHSELPRRMVAFQLAYPRVRLAVEFSDTRRSLVEDGFDLAIRMALAARNSATTRKLFHVRRHLVAAPSFLAGQEPAQEPEQLRSWDWLELSAVQHYAKVFSKGDREQVVKPARVKVSSNDANALYCFARAGGGLALLPEILAADDIASGQVEIVLPDWTAKPAQVFAEWPSNAPRHGLTRLFVDHLSKETDAVDQRG